MTQTSNIRQHLSGTFGPICLSCSAVMPQRNTIQRLLDRRDTKRGTVDTRNQGVVRYPGRTSPRQTQCAEIRGA